MYKKSITIVLLALFFPFFTNGQSKKELQSENETLKVEIDSLRRSLAAARRELKKCTDNYVANQGELTAKWEQTEAIAQNLTAKLSETEAHLQHLRDTLNQTKAACVILQVEMAKHNQIEFALETRARNLQTQLNDSLAAWFGAQLSMVRYKERVSMTLGDSLLFGGGISVNYTGQKFLRELLNVINTHQNIKLVITGWGAPTSTKQALGEGMRRALAVAMILETYKWSSNRLIVVGQAAVASDNKKFKKPIRIDFLPLEDSRF